MSGQGILENVKDAAEVISEKIAEVGSGLPPGEEPDKPFKMPTRDELLAALDSMGLGEQEKEELRAALLDESPLGLGAAAAQPWTTQALILICFMAVVASIFLFIGYRLYKSMNDRELKKEEKKQKKLLKKRR